MYAQNSVRRYHMGGRVEHRRVSTDPTGAVGYDCASPDGWYLHPMGDERISGGYWGDRGWVAPRIGRPLELRYQLDGEIRGAKAAAVEYLAGCGFTAEEAAEVLAGLKCIIDHREVLL